MRYEKRIRELIIKEDWCSLVKELDNLKGSYAVEYVLGALLTRTVKETVPGLEEHIKAARNKVYDIFHRAPEINNDDDDDD